MIVALVLFYEAMVAAMTALGCKLAQKRHRQTGWHVAFITAVVIAALISISSGWHYLMHPENLSWAPKRDKESLSAIVFGFLWLAGMALPVALFVVYLFRKKHGKLSHAP